MPGQRDSDSKSLRFALSEFQVCVVLIACSSSQSVLFWLCILYYAVLIDPEAFGFVTSPVCSLSDVSC